LSQRRGRLANPGPFPHNSREIHWGSFMSAVFFKKLSFALAAVSLGWAISPQAGFAYTPEQQQACQGDAFRLCGPEIPDVDRVTACMVAKQAQLSPGCRVYFRHSAQPRPVSGKSHRKTHAKPANT
jgi:hypothetical protein